jgi:calcineurin-like phosphoesterase family protein
MRDQKYNHRMSLSRRDVLKGAAAAAAAGALPSTVMSRPKPLTFGIIADIHQDVMHDGEARLEAFIEEMKKQEVDFVLQLGDFCIPKKGNRPFMDIWNSFSGPKYHVLGNHDTDGGYSQEQTQDFWEMPEQFYSFDRGGLHMVVLDGNDLHEGRAPGYPRYIGPEQQEWLRADLAATSLPTMIFSHQSVQETDGGIENTAELQAIINEANKTAGHNKVFAALSGHHHIDLNVDIKGVKYVQINSAAYQWIGGDYQAKRYSDELHKAYPYLSYVAPYREPLWCTATVHTEGWVEIKGSRTEWISPDPWELGVPEKGYLTKQVCRPVISSRNLSFTPRT